MKKQLFFIITLVMAVMMLSMSVVASDMTEEIQNEQELISVDVNLSENGEIIVGDYSTIEVEKSNVEVTDEEVEYEVTMMLANFADADGTTPELTDEFVSSNSLSYLGVQVNTVEDLRPTIHDLLYRSNMISEIWPLVSAEAEVISYPEEEFNIVRSYLEAQLEYEVFFYSMYGIDGADEEYVAQMYGYATPEDFINGEAMSYMNDVMLLDKIAEDLGITYTDEDVDNAIAEMMIMNGMETTYTIDEFKEQSGEAWVFLESKLDVEYNLVMDALIERATVVDNGDVTD